MTAREAVVLGHVDYGEADRVVRLLTPEQGRIAAMARGIRRGRNALRSLVEPGARLSIALKRGRGRLPLLQEASPVQLPHRARADLDRLALLTYGVELCGLLAPEDHEAPRLYRLLATWIALVEGPEAPGIASRQALEAKALTFAGLTPALVACPICGERLEAPTVWSPAAGGGAHGRCAQGPAIDPEALIRLEALRRTPLRDTPGVRPSEGGWCLSDFARWHLGKPLHTRDLLESLAP
jgi:DNA repair protein RecO (recombination protein O)